LPSGPDIVSRAGNVLKGQKRKSAKSLIADRRLAWRLVESQHWQAEKAVCLPSLFETCCPLRSSDQIGSGPLPSGHSLQAPRLPARPLAWNCCLLYLHCRETDPPSGQGRSKPFARFQSSRYQRGRREAAVVYINSCARTRFPHRVKIGPSSGIDRGQLRASGHQQHDAEVTVACGRP
jgi:hypothetical protein